jgi:hypothetical protein
MNITVKTNKAKRLIISALFALTLLASAVAFLLSAPVSVGAGAVPNVPGSGATGADYTVTVNLDTNGKITVGQENTVSELNSNNSGGPYAVRRFSNTLFSDIITSDTDAYVIENADGKAVENSGAAFVGIELAPDGTSIKLTAKKFVEVTPVVVRVQNQTTAAYKYILLDVKIAASLAQKNLLNLTPADYDKKVIIAGVLPFKHGVNSDLTAVDVSGTALYEPFVLNVKNNTNVTYTLTSDNLYDPNVPNEGILVNRILHRVDPANASKSGVPIFEDADVNSNPTSGTPWVITDVSRLRIQSVNIEGPRGVEITSNNPTDDDPDAPSPGSTFNIRAAFKWADLDEWTLDNKMNEFWNGIFPLKIVFAEQGGDVEVRMFVRFQPGAAPLMKETFFMPTELNAGIPETHLFGPNPQTGIYPNRNAASGYRSVVVRPEDLVDYPSKDAIYFLENAGPPSGDTASVSRVTCYAQKDSNNKTYYVVTALENGAAFIQFNVRYKPPGENEPEKTYGVPVAFGVYGKYTLDPIELGGKKFKIGATGYEAFTQIRRDGFVLKSVSLADAAFASAQYKNGFLEIDPIASGATDITFVFQGYASQSSNLKTIEVTTKLDVNLDRNNWWKPLQDWAKALIIIAFALIVTAFILLIIWLFIRAVNRSKREAYETSAPASPYIVKLNSTIAAAQAQQRLVGQYAAVQNQQSQMLQLGASPSQGVVGGPVPGQLGQATNTLALGMGNTASVPPYQDAAQQSYGYQNGAAQNSYAQNSYTQNSYAAGAAPSAEYNIPMTDEALIERIYAEKYEPRGMTRRAFFKSKDLQSRELEKEKARIRENMRVGMTPEEACKTDKEREAETAGGIALAPVAPATDDIVTLLGFDPDAPLITETEEEAAATKPSAGEKKIVIDENGNEKLVYDEISDEEDAAAAAQKEYDRLLRESVILKQRAEKAAAERDKTDSDIAARGETIASTENLIKEYSDKITDLEVQIAAAKGKERDRLTGEKSALENDVRFKQNAVLSLENEIAGKQRTREAITDAVSTIAAQSGANARAVAQAEKDLRDAEALAKAAAERAQKAKERQIFERQSAYLSPLLESIAHSDREIVRLNEVIERKNDEKSRLKSEVSAIQSQLLSATDSAAIARMSDAIKEKNGLIGACEQEITSAVKQKSDKSAELASRRRKANDYISNEKMDVDKVVELEDSVLAKVILDEMRAKAEQDKLAAEDSISRCQALYDDLVKNSDASLAQKAAGYANEIKTIEDEANDIREQAAAMALLIDETPEDEKEAFLADQQLLTERLGELEKTLEELRVNGVKENLEFKMKSEEDMREAAEALERAKTDYELANGALSNLLSSASVSDQFTSGSGLVSQDRKAIEAANLKKLLEQSQNDVEHARLQAKMAQMEAEKAIIDAERASAASKEEAEKIAREAVANAEKAKQAAEEKAEEEARRAQEEIERVRREAEAEAERVRHEAEVEAEKLKKEAESAMRTAEGEVERVKQEAVAEAEKVKEEAERARFEAEEARRLAEDEAARARRLAEDEAARARREAGEEAEKARKAAEDEAAKIKAAEDEAAKKLAEEQAEKARKAAEELAEKISKRKLEIAALRNGLKDIQTEQQGNELKEKFYDIQLHFDADEQDSVELRELIERSMNDAAHAAELARYKAAAAQGPRRIVKKVTERVNKISRPPQGARPAARPGSRPAGPRINIGIKTARNTAAARPGVRPASAGAARPAPRPAGARPVARPAGATRPVARPAGARPVARPAGARPAPRPAGATRPVARPTGTRPAPRPGSRPPVR